MAGLTMKSIIQTMEFTNFTRIRIGTKSLGMKEGLIGAMTNFLKSSIKSGKEM